MMIKRRAAMVALAAVVFVGVALVTDAAARIQAASEHRGQVTTHGPRAAVGATTNGDRRFRAQRLAWVSASNRSAAEWVHVLSPGVHGVDGVDVVGCCQSRGPPA